MFVEKREEERWEEGGREVGGGGREVGGGGREDGRRRSIK